jgi:hypothetical protein
MSPSPRPCFYVVFDARGWLGGERCVNRGDEGLDIIFHAVSRMDHLISILGDRKGEWIGISFWNVGIICCGFNGGFQLNI